MTRFEQIAAAFPLHCQRIAECVYQHNPYGPTGLANFLTAPSDAFNLEHGGAVLQGAFMWEFSEEGHNYWSALANGARL